MANSSGRQSFDGAVRVLIAIAGTLPAAVFCAIALARRLPSAEPTRFAIGFSLAISFWVFGMSLGFLASNALRACAWCLAVTAVFAALAGC